MNAISQQMYANFESVEDAYLEKLSELKGERVFRSLVPNKLANSFISNDFSLLDVLKLSDYDAMNLKGFGKLKLDMLHAFQQELLNNQDKFNSYELEVSVPFGSYLPFDYNSEDDILTSVYKSIDDYINTCFVRKNAKIKRNIDLCAKYYGLSSEPSDIADIMLDQKLTSERVRQIVKGDKFRLIQLYKGITENGISIHPELMERIQHVVSKTKYHTDFAKLVSVNSISNQKKVERLAELLSLSLVDADELGYFLVDENEIHSFREHLRSLIQTICYETLPQSLSTVINKSRKDYKHTVPFKPEIIISLLDNKKLFDLIENEDNTTMFQIKWHLTSNQKIKIKRILIDNGEMMHADDILEEYNRRCESAGIDQIERDQLHPLTDENLKTYGKSGYWQYVENDEDFENLDHVWIVIEDFVKSRNGIARFQEIKDHLIALNLIYKDFSIRAYTFRSCFVSAEDGELFIHADYREQYPQIPLRQKQQANIINSFVKKTISILRKIGEISKKELLAKVIHSLEEDGFIITYGNASTYLSNFTDLGIFVQNGEDYDKTIVIDEDELNQYNVDELGKRKEPVYRGAIRSQAIQFLKGRENYSASLDELWELSKEYFPENIRKSNFYRVFSDNNFFEKVEEGDKRLVRLIPELLPAPQEYTVEVQAPVEPTVQQVREIRELSSPQIASPVIRKAFVWEELRFMIEKELGNYHLSREVVEIGMEAFYNSLHKAGKMSRWADVLLQHLYELWFTKTDFYDRDVCFQKLTHSYETYVKILTRNPYDEEGLTKILDSIPVLKELREYKYKVKTMSYYEVDRTRKTFSNIMGSLIFYRNQYTHDNDSDSLDMSFSKHIEQVTNFIALYIYTAYLVENENY